MNDIEQPRQLGRFRIRAFRRAGYGASVHAIVLRLHTWCGDTRLRGAFVAVALAVVLVASMFLPQAEASPVFCVFRRITSVPCPSCGMTHSFVAMGHGHWLQAWHAHLAGPELFCAVLVGLAFALAQTVTGVPLWAALWTRVRRVVVPLTVTLMAASWVINLLYRFGS